MNQHWTGYTSHWPMSPCQSSSVIQTLWYWQMTLSPFPALPFLPELAAGLFRAIWTGKWMPDKSTRQRGLELVSVNSLLWAQATLMPPLPSDSSTILCQESKIHAIQITDSVEHSKARLPRFNLYYLSVNSFSSKIFQWSENCLLLKETYS